MILSSPWYGKKLTSRSGGNFNETSRTRVTLARAIKNSTKGVTLADYLIREDSVTAFFMDDVMNTNTMQSRNSTCRNMVVDDTEDILHIIKIGLEEKNLQLMLLL